MDEIQRGRHSSLLEENSLLKEKNLRQQEQIAFLMQRVALLDERLRQNSRKVVSKEA